MSDYPIAPRARRRPSARVFARVAKSIGCEEAAIRAVFDVEAASDGFDADGRVKILNERHKLYERTSGKTREKLVKAGLARKTAGGYPRSSDGRYRWLTEARKIAGDAAYEAISMGFPQIMGFNAKSAGYRSAREMYEAFARSADEQITAFARLITSDKRLLTSIRKKKWTAFARAYNGPAYKRNRYDEKMAAAYRRHARGVTRPVSFSPDILDRGDKGSRVEGLQRDLKNLGFAITADGDFGPVTEEAIKTVQRKAGLPRTGRADEATINAISSELGRSAKSKTKVAKPKPTAPRSEPTAPPQRTIIVEPPPVEKSDGDLAVGGLMAVIALAVGYASGAIDAAIHAINSILGLGG